MVAIESFAQKLNSGVKLKPEQAITDVRHHIFALNIDLEKKAMDGYNIINSIIAKPTKLLHRLHHQFTRSA